MNSTLPPAPHPEQPAEDAGLSQCSVALLEGRSGSISCWVCPQTSVSVLTSKEAVPDMVAELALGLAPGRLVVIGRATPDCPVPYLDPAYRATPTLPDSGACVLNGNDPSDDCVSRAHFTLRGTAEGGVVFTNGVPRLGGGVRPPMNGTKLLAPTVRYLEPGEEVLILYGEAIAIRLPNHCVLQLRAR